MNRVALVAGGLARFGKREASWRDLAAEGGKATLEDLPELSPEKIDGVIVATADEEPYLAAVASEILGIKPKIATRVENLCSSGGTAITVAYSLISSGLINKVLVLGVEKMCHRQTVPLLEWDFTRGGVLMPAAWGAVYAQKHMEKFGTTEEQLALISVKNHRLSSMNPFAHFQKPITLNEVMSSRHVVTPLKLYDCCSKSDGAAGVILAGEDEARSLTDTPVWIKGLGESSQGATFGNVNPEYVTWPCVKIAAKEAYQTARVEANKIDLAMLHDAFTINEIIEYEDLGFARKGEGGRFIEQGQSEIGGKVAVNTHGGLIGVGPPIGATGVAQAVEILAQFRGTAGKRQVGRVENGLTLNLSASVSTGNVIIYGRNSH